MSYAESLVKAGKTHKRKAADFYPTPTAATVGLLNAIEPHVKAGSRILEPCCGDGAISKVLTERGHDVTSFDLRTDSGYGQGGVNFLDYQLPDTDANYDWIITNPPFNIAEDFINKSLALSMNVAMLLKATYFHAACRKKLFTETPPSEIYALQWRLAFLKEERGNSPMMECAWFVWRADHKWPEGTTYNVISRPTD